MGLNDELLKQFMTTFYGSGNYEGDYWFVGMEEGGGNDLDEVSERFTAWETLGKTELVDIVEFHKLIGYSRYFTGPKNKLQPTWKQQARIVLAAKGLPADTEDTRTYQRESVGRKNNETCLLELFPLPSPSGNDWNYDRWSKLPVLKSRKAYEEDSVTRRTEHIKARIQEYKPKVVVFMGIGYEMHWKSIAGLNFGNVNNDGFRAERSEDTLYILMKHPTARGGRNEYFKTIGKYLSQYL